MGCQNLGPSKIWGLVRAALAAHLAAWACPPREKLPSDNKGTGGQIEPSPSNPATTARPKGKSWIPRQGTQSIPTGLFRELWPDSSPATAHHGRRRGRRTCRRPAPPGGAGEQLNHGKAPKLGKNPTLPRRPAAPLTVTPAGEAAEGEGEGGQRVNSQAGEHGRRGEGGYSDPPGLLYLV
jgi:hypothetical protein